MTHSPLLPPPQGKLSGMSIPIIEEKVGVLMRRDRAALHNTLETPQVTHVFYRGVLAVVFP